MATIDTIRQYFADILQRSGSEVTSAEINSYVSAVDSGALTLAQVRVALIQSPEGQDVQDVVRLYQTVFGRVPDKAGLNDQVDTLRGPATESDLANSFANSPEFISRFGGNTVNTAFINAVYQQVLGRTPSAGEVNFYLNSGFSAGRIALAFSESPEFQAATSTAVVGFLDAAGQGTAVYTGSLGGTVNVGTTFTLTAGVDAPGAVAPAVNTAGTAQNDTYNAVNGSINTLTSADQIDGGNGTDTLNLLLDDDASVASLANVKNVEIFNLRDTANGTTVDFAGVTGETQVWNDRSSGTGTMSFTNLGTGTTVGVRGDGNTSVAATSFSMATATDAISIAIDGGVKGGKGITRDQTGEAAVTISSTGGANTVGVIDLDNAGATVKSVTINAATALTASLAADYAAASTLTVNGAGKVDLSGAALSANLTTVNAAGSTGGVNIVASTTAADLKFTGGSGADRVALGGTLTAADTIVGGAGTDTIAITGVDLTAPGNVAQLNGLNTKVTGFEVLEFTGATGATIAGGTGTGAFTNSEITKLLFNTTAADTINNAGSTRTYAFGETNTGDAAFTLSAGTTSVNVSLEGIAGNGADVGAVSFALNAAAPAGQTATINLASTGPGTVANTTGALTATAGSTFNVTGAHDLTIDSLANGGTINASSFTGKLTATGSAANDVITGGSGNDILVGGDGVDTINGGAGNNTITGGAGIDAITLSNGGTDIVRLGTAAVDRDTVTGFQAGAGGDIIDVAKPNQDATVGGTDNVGAAQFKDFSATQNAYTFASTNTVQEFSFNAANNSANLGNATDGTELFKAIANQGSTVSSITLGTAADSGTIVAYQNGNAYVYAYDDGALGDGSLAAGEIALVGTFSNVAVGSMTDANFA